MKNKIFGITILILIVVVGFFFVSKFLNIDILDNENSDTNIKRKLEVIAVSINDNHITLMDKNDVIYNVDKSIINVKLGDKLVLEYKNVLNNNNNKEIEVVNYELIDDNNLFSRIFDDNGIFSTYYKMAYNKLNELSLDEKIGQLILARYPNKNVIEDLQNYKLGGYVFFANDFKNKSEVEVQEMINTLQNTSNIPLITSVDEEGGKVVRISSNKKLVPEKFKSSRELYLLGGMDKIKEDTINKSNVLFKLGLNVNLAPVVDVSTNPSDYMYERSLGEDPKTTSLFAETVINASKESGVSYVLKHFPGYGNNADTHKGSVVDSRTYESILQNDLPPFIEGIENGAEAIMVSHNTVSSIDNNNPASLSPKIHNLLREDLGFSGIIITDDLYMGATSKIEDSSIKAILAGNNLLITTDYAKSINSIRKAINGGIISEKLIDKLAFKVLAWKYYKGLMMDTK